MKKKFSIYQIMVYIFLMCYSFTSNAAYFKNLLYTITQPNGQKIECFVSGDEFFNWLHDANDYTIIQSSDGYYYYATYDVNNAIVPSKYVVNTINPQSVGLSKNIRISDKEYQNRVNDFYKYTDKSVKAPHAGALNNLAVYIRFSDDTEFTNLRQVYETKLNATTGKSLFSYYHEVSYNTLNINTTHYPICPLTSSLSYQDAHPRAYYQPYNATTNPIGYTDPERTEREHTLLVNAINYIAASVPTGLNIDGDNDGKVDNVCFIIKGGNGAWANLLWAHRWSLYSQTVNINGKRVYDYTFQPESQVDVQTLCHEMFHALGAPDLYHYSYDGFVPAGAWDIMESGFGHMGAFMKYKYTDQTWITDIPEITTSGTYVLKPLASPTNNCYKINSPVSSSEYFVLEYRKKEGLFESSIPGSGLLIYRINPLAGNGNAQGPPDEVYIYRIGGTPTANGSINGATFSKNVNRTLFNDLTNPFCFFSDGTLADIDIYDIGISDTTISFKVGFNQKPHSNFVANDTTIKELESVNFTNLTSGNPTSCFWDFGNGITSTDFNPQNITYSEAGNYTVTLISTNANGTDTIIKENYINVSPSMLNCSDAVFVFANIPYNGNTSLGHSNVNKYNCKSWTETGPEVVHIITTNAVGDITGTLINMNNDLDIFLLSNCKENSCFMAGNNSITYSNAPIGTYYFVVDGNNEGTYTLTISYPSNSIKENNNQSYFTILPNPTNGNITIKINDINFLNKISNIQIYSFLGKQIMKENFTIPSAEKTINITSFPSGIYFLQIVLSDGRSYTKKIIKND